MKKATYFEDLQKTVFVIKVESDGKSWLEQREWHKNDYESCPDDEFERLRASGVNSYEQYEWIAVRSNLRGISKDTEKWTDREWYPAPKV